ncbi:MAG: DegT/DnrJ/EryC1/StrS family aminotransferase [Pseudomonadota bacterium]
MIPRLRPSLGAREFVSAFLARYSLEDFESAFADLAGQTEAIAFPYGRTGLLLLLEALGLKGREIILPSYTCVVVAHAIVLSGNQPVFIDSASDNFNMDLDLAEARIGEQTGALIATSIHGYPVDLDRLDAIRNRHPDVVVIQDCAHGFMSQWNGHPVQKHGRAAIFGLNVSKLMTSIFGGMVTTDDCELAARLRELRAARLSQSSRFRDMKQVIYLTAASAALHPLGFSLVNRMIKTGALDRFVKYYDEGKIDMPADYLATLGRAAASVGYAQCGRYDEIVAARRRISATYDRLLSGSPHIQPAPLVDGATYSHYVARVKDPVSLVAKASTKGVELGRVIDYCVPDFAAYRGMVPDTADFPRTRQLNSEIVNLPLSVSEAEAERVADVVRACLHAS